MKRSTGTGRRVFVVGDARRAGVRDAAARLRSVLGTRARVVGQDLEAKTDLRRVRTDLFAVLGGDGAILAAARRTGPNRAPLVGINLGHLGFLAAVRVEELDQAAEEIFVAGRYAVSERMTLAVDVRHADGRREPPMRALNDAVVERWDARTLSVDMRADGAPTTTFRGDGLIVATPTGSTAHSLAAGGPVVEPSCEVFVVTPMCAHSMTNRPLVLRPDQSIELRVLGGSRKPGLAVDGQILVDLREGSVVRVRRSKVPARLALPAERSFYDVLRTRLHWAGQTPGGPYGADGASGGSLRGGAGGANGAS